MQNKKYKYPEKVLPNQEFFKYLYQDSAPFETALYNLLLGYAPSFDTKRFDLVTPKEIDFEEMSTPPWQLAILGAIIRLTRAKTVLEIGTFIGNSAMQFANMVGEDGHVTTIELGKEFADLASENFKRNGYEKRVTLLQGSAGKMLEGLKPDSFDLVFVDGSKQDYLDYSLKSEKLLTRHGTIIVDDVFFHGDALNATPSTDKGRGCKDLLDHYEKQDHFDKLLLPVANGILLLFKK
ncbi:MAG: putative caffeoyl-CoA O-methyltransferase [Spartobacteria bacterium]|nr:putative caffeoyl-CoA O-methyltransferase [Spartobacteria bacterium]